MQIIHFFSEVSSAPMGSVNPTNKMKDKSQGVPLRITSRVTYAKSFFHALNVSDVKKNNTKNELKLYY